MPNDLDSTPQLRRAVVIAFVAGLLAGVVLLLVLRRPESAVIDTLKKENQLLRDMNSLLEAERAKVRKVLDEGAE